MLTVSFFAPGANPIYKFKPLAGVTLSAKIFDCASMNTLGCSVLKFRPNVLLIKACYQALGQTKLLLFSSFSVVKIKHCCFELMSK